MDIKRPYALPMFTSSHARNHRTSAGIQIEGAVKTHRPLAQAPLHVGNQEQTTMNAGNQVTKFRLQHLEQDAKKMPRFIRDMPSYR
ncbi:MAG: hypothetical protein A2854_02280 [Parcubacteria group bacterium RIFCSPHIGHO2_01_FULL_56_18]|nr:MAG: hypothetical protein A2854_02280 [Parcubacteria group bacterium RIFCSPHIGHO2_01_FULL_56_18]